MPRNPPVTRAGDTVTYHGADGDIDAVVKSFGPLSDAELEFADGTVRAQVPKGPKPLHWERKKRARKK